MLLFWPIGLGMTPFYGTPPKATDTRPFFDYGVVGDLVVCAKTWLYSERNTDTVTCYQQPFTVNDLSFVFLGTMQAIALMLHCEFEIHKQFPSNRNSALLPKQ